MKSTAVSRAIEDAIKGGWKGLGKNKKEVRRRLHNINEIGVVLEEGVVYESDDAMLLFEEIFLSKSFWVALGKARGWPQSDARRTYNDVSAEPNWLWYWHSFIDHLAEGKDAESFFSDLIN